VSVTESDEAPRSHTGPGFSDAVTYAFGDVDAQLFGIARVGLAPGEGGTTEASGLAILFAGFEPIAVRAAGGLTVDAGAGWDDVDAAGVRTLTHVPLKDWDVSFTSDDGRSGFQLRYTALSPAGALTADRAAAIAGGTEGYDQLCRVTGLATVHGEERAVHCLGQRGHSWGAPDWERIALARTVSAWIEEDLALSVTAIRPANAKSHADEALAASLFATLDEDGAVEAIAIEEARLSTTSDADGRQRRASIEVFVDEDDPGRRAAGQVLCGTSLDLGRLRLDCAFFAWRMDGRSGVGRYDVLRRATDLRARARMTAEFGHRLAAPEATHLFSREP